MQLIFNQKDRENNIKVVIIPHLLQVSIRGGPDIFVHEGGAASLECVLTRFILPPGPGAVSWSHDGHILGEHWPLIGRE